MAKRLKVLVVGASIAGPHTAYWLWRAGAEVTIIERSPTPHKRGQNIDIRAIGVATIRRAPGLEAKIKDNLHTLEALRFVDTHGTAIGTMTTTDNPEEQFIMSEYEIFRDRLSEILCDMTRTRPGVKYLYGEQVSALGHGEECTTVEFANGTPAQTFDLVVACDGTTSRTRAIGFGCGVRDHISVGGRFISLGPDPDCKGNRVMLMSIHRNEHSATLEDFRGAQKKGERAVKHHAMERFTGSGWMSDRILKAMLDSEDFYASEIVQVRVPQLFKDRLVLVGDAGYSPGPTGMGTSLALTGGYVLAGELARSAGDIDAALHAYQQRMKPMIAEYQKIPPGAPGFMAPQTENGIFWRNVAFRIFCFCVKYARYFSWLGKYWAASFGGGDKFHLPDYEWCLQDDEKVQ